MQLCVDIIMPTWQPRIHPQTSVHFTVFKLLRGIYLVYIQIYQKYRVTSTMF